MPLNADEAQRQREQYVRAFNSTMVKIWREKIELLSVIDSGRLFNSVVGVSMSADAKFTSVSLSQEFLEYGVYVERGTGSNTQRGNGGDIGRDNRRKKKPWMFRKHLASLFNIREFFADSLGQQSVLAISNALEKSPSFNKSDF